MAGKLFNIYSGNTGGVLSTSTAKVGSFGTTSDDFYSVNFDTGRKSIWTNNIEFGRSADWGNISGIPSWIESDGVTWGKVKDKPATATRWPYWSEILSKPAAIGSATQPVYWDGSTFQLVNSVAPASHDHDDRYLKLTGGTLSGDLAFSHGSSSTDQHITWASGTNYQRLKVRDGQTDVFIFQYSTDSGTTWSDYFTIQNGTAKIGTYTVYHSGNLPAYPTVNNGALNLQASGTTKVTFYANQSGTSNFNIATGSANGTISVGGTDVAVKGLGSNAYTSTAYLPLAGGQMTGNITWKNSTALPEQSSPQYFLVIDAFTDGGATKWSSKANTLNVLTGLTSTAKGTTSKPIYWDGTKFVECLAYSQASVNYANSAGSVEWTDVKNKPSTFTPSAHDHTYLKKNFKSEGITNIPFTGEQFEYGILTGAATGVASPADLTAFDSYSQVEYINLPWYSNLYGGQLMFGANSGKIGYRTIHNGTWTLIKEIIHSSNYTTYTVKKDGTGATGTWGISITGNAGSADKLKTARTITINGSSKTFDGSGNISWSLADLNIPSNDHNHDTVYVKKAGDTMSGVLHLLGAQYTDTAGTGALDLANSDIYGVNSIKFADLSDTAAEGLQWYRDATHVDSIWVKKGVIYFTPNRTWQGTGTDYTIYHSGNLTAATLLGSTAKGNTTKPIYWDGSKLVECIAYSQASVNHAITADTTTNLANNPSLQAGTNDTNKITVTAGGKTSSEFTVPFATNSDTLDGKHANSFVEKIISTGPVVFIQSSVYQWDGVLITTPFTWSNPNTPGMFAFTIRSYIGYEYSDIVISGYCYGNSKWHDPECIVIGGKQRYEIKFGWFDTADSNGAKHLYLWFGRGLNANNEPLKLGYGGFSIINVHCGHSNVDVYTGWSATNTNPNNLTNVQKTSLPGYGNADYATSAGNADTVDNYHAAGLLTAASLGASGNDTTISVSVGGTTKTGSVTVPYASNAGNADTVDDEHLSQFWKHGGAYPYGKSDKPWHKIATFTQSVASYQINTCLTLYISEFYSQQAYGILNIRVRAKAGGATLDWLKLEWSLNVNIPVTNFIGTYKKSGNDIIINVYANRTGWSSYSAVKIEEQAWGVNQDVWTLIHANNSSNSYASIPSDETQVTSVICTLNHNISGSADNADTVDGYHASGLLTSASLGASGNSTTISVSVGGTTKTGSVTVPYASNAGNADTVDGKHASDFAESGHNHDTRYVKLDGGATEQTIKNSISTLNKGVINLWRSSGDHFTFLGFSNGTTETYLGGIGFKSSTDHNIYFRSYDATGAAGCYKIWHEGNDGVNSGLDADTLDTFHAADLFQTLTNDATNNAVKIKIGDNEKSLVVGYATKANTANSSEWSEYLNNYTTTDPNTGAIKASKVKWFAYITSSSGYAGNNYGFKTTNNANGILYLGTYPGKYGHQLGFSGNGNIYHRYQNGADFPNTANGGSWEVLLTSNNYTTITDTRYVKKAGDTMTGLLTTTSAHSHDGIKVGDTYINAINGNLIFQNNSAIRFGGDTWNYNEWAGLKYVHSSKTIYLGLADGSSFTANSPQSGGKLYLPGIDNIYTGNGKDLIWHGGNDGSGSGLDADLLDGKHANEFRFLGRDNNYSTTSTWNGLTPINAFGFRHGYPHFIDPDFATGPCGVTYYNRGQSPGAITRLTDAQALAADENYFASGNSSGYVLKISTTSVVSNNIGGFYQVVNANDNKVWVQVFRALLPNGATLSHAANSMGTGNKVQWLTSNTGTGKWEWYAIMFYNGHGGSYSSFGHMSAYLYGATTANVWYLSYCNMYEISNGNYDGLRTRFADHATSSDSATSVEWANITGKATSKTAWGQTFVDSSGNIQSISGDMTSVGQVTPDGNATRSNGTSTANWASVYTRSIISGDHLTLTSGTAKDIIFKTNAGTEYMRLTSGGLLGVGTNSPSEVLHVNGNVKANKFHSDANSSTDLTHIPTDTEIVLETGNGNGNVSAWIWREKYAASNWGVFHDNSANYLHVVGNSISRVAINLSNGRVGIGTTSPEEILHVAGLIKSVSSSKYLRIGCQNGSHAHYETNAGISHWFNKRVDVNGDIWVYNTNYGITSTGGFYSKGFYHRDYMNNNYVLLSNGGAKQWSESSIASTIVARTADNHIYAGYYNSDISNEDDMTPTSVYCSTDNFIKKQSIGKFADNLRADEIITITKTLAVTEAWMDTGIVMNTDTFPRATGTYIIQIYSDTYGADGYYPYYSGIMSIYTASTSGSLEDEVPLHCVGYANGGTVQDKRIYIRTVEQLNSNAKIQIAAASTLSSHTYTFKFRKLI